MNKKGSESQNTENKVITLAISLKRVKNGIKLSTMVGEKFEFDLSQIAKNAFKLFTIVGENSQS